MDVRLPRLMYEQAGKRIEYVRLKPARLSVTENLTPLSTAEMVLPASDKTPQVRQWVELYDQHGSLGYYRVAAVRTDYGQEKTVSLEHGIVTLEDCTAPEDAELTGTMREILTAILSWQQDARWTLGTVEVPDTQTFTLSAGNQIALQALLDAADMAPDYRLSFQMDESMWTVGLTKLPEETACEVRFGRNVSAAGVTTDESGLCTRVTHSLLPNGYLDAYTASTWGIVSRPLDAPEDATAETVLALANEYLAAHREPSVTAEIDGIDLSNETGESLDALQLGTVCNAVMNDNGTIRMTRATIISLYRPDVLGAPEEVRMTLSSGQRTTQSVLAGLQKDIDRNSRSTSQKFKYIREELDRLILEAPSIELISRVNVLEQKADDQILHMNEVSVRLNGVEAELALKASQESYSKVAATLSEVEVTLAAAQAQILLKASQTTVDELGERVSEAEIAIDGAESRIALKADKIDLQGYVTIDAFEAFKGDISDLWADELRTTYVSADNVVAGYGDFDTIVAGSYNGHTSYVLSMGSLVSAEVLSKSAINLSHSHAVSVGADGTVTLGEVSATGGNFNVADTKIYQDGVSAAYNSGKSEWRPTIVARTGVDPTNKTVTVSVSNLQQTLLTNQVVSAVEVYDAGFAAGWASAAAKVTQDGRTIYGPTAAVGGQETKFTITVGGEISSIRNTAANVFHAMGQARAYINGSQVQYQTISKSQTINVGQ